MKNMTLEAIAKACNGQLQLRGDAGYIGREVQGVVLDSRKVRKDYLFIATVGEQVDGHDYIESAFDHGAMAVICEKAPRVAKGPFILVKDSFAALKAVAGWYRRQLDIKVVGITGSVGKTSTKEFISSVLSQKYSVLKTEGNYNNEVGLPLTILRIRDTHDVAVLEMGISEFGEMHRLSEIARPDICVITNIGLCHLENLGSRAGVLKAKTEIFDSMNEDGIVCINGDDDMLATIAYVKGRKPIRYGFDMENDVYPTDIIGNGLLGSICDIHTGEGVIHVQIPLPGEHMIRNALATAAVGRILGLSDDEISSGIHEVKPVGGRSNIIQLGAYTVIDDCYNANPNSMKAAIDLLNTAPPRRIAILGDMFELGRNENELHKEVGIYAAASSVDVIICAGRLSSNMYEGAKSYYGSNIVSTGRNFNDSIIYFETRDELIASLPKLLKEGDSILVKASHGMGFEHVVQAILNL